MKQQEPVPADAGWIVKGIREFPGPPSLRFGQEWTLITARDDRPGGDADWNTMTAAWGGLGVLWSRDVAFMFIRPSRRTFDFANAAPLFTLSFFDGSHRGALDFCGAKSGRDVDKAAGAGLSPILFGDTPGEGKIAGALGFKEAKEIIVCRKLYTHDFDPAAFLDAPSIEEAYHGSDYHRMYIGEVLSLLTRG
jgi:flavin reductase (DIM6/NTAB) family NADH-FMN oxidoreductase RutF